jgi:hypothetical protein
MKYACFAVFEAGAKVDDLLSNLHDQGFNGTYLSGASINSLVQSFPDDEPSVISLRSVTNSLKKENPTFFLIVKEEQLPTLKRCLEDYTANYAKIRGGFFGWPLSFFEGSF